MGCDIHLFAEIRSDKSIVDTLDYDSNWKSIDHWESDEEEDLYVPYEKRFYNGGRNYNLFCALCGVRSGMFTDQPKSISKPKGLPKDCSKEIKDISDRWNGDGHSHSWNTLRELKEFNWSDYGETVAEFIQEVIPKMEEYGVGEDNIRIVYFFDN